MATCTCIIAEPDRRIYGRPVHRVFTTIQLLIGIAAACFTLTAPSAAWAGHDLAHLAAPVAADVHHHHDGEAGSVVLDKAGAPADDDEGGDGHDHMPSLSAGLAATLADGPAPLPALPASLHLAPRPASLLLGTADPPPARPPRTN